MWLILPLSLAVSGASWLLLNPTVAVPVVVCLLLILAVIGVSSFGLLGRTFALLSEPPNLPVSPAIRSRVCNGALYVLLSSGICLALALWFGHGVCEGYWAGRDPLPAPPGKVKAYYWQKGNETWVATPSEIVKHHRDLHMAAAILATPIFFGVAWVGSLASVILVGAVRWPQSRLTEIWADPLDKGLNSLQRK